MPPDELQTMIAIGAVTHASARIWARVDRAGAVRLVLSTPGAPPQAFELQVPADAPDGTCAWTIPDDVPGAPQLEPDTAYEVELARADGAAVGKGRFTTAPDPAAPPQPFRFAAWSCHEPFAPDGTVRESARSMLRAAHAALTAREVRFALALGDQIYADHPACLSLLDDAYFRAVAPPGRASILDCTREEVRALYQQRYRQAWALPELAPLHAEVPSWPTLDDHEIVNNAGSLPEHASPAWAALWAGALDAFHDYQASRVLPTRAPRPTTFDQGFRWGHVAVYLLDVRARRRAGPERTQLYEPAQLDALGRFLAAHADARLLVLAVSVPIAYVPSWFAIAADVLKGASDGADRWSHPRTIEDRDRLLGALLAHAEAHPHQNLLLVSGDIHCGTAFAIAWDDGPVFHQLSASPLTNELPPGKAAIYSLVPHLERTITCDGRTARVSPIPGADGAPDTNPFGGLNLGVVHVDEDGRVRLELVTAGADGAPETVYLSPWVGRGR